MTSQFFLLIFLLIQPIHHQADFGTPLALDLGKPTIFRNFIPTQSRFIQNIAKLTSHTQNTNIFHQIKDNYFNLAILVPNFYI